MRAGILSAGIYLRSLAAFVAVWWLAATWTANPLLLPAPDRVGEALVALASSGELFVHAGVSLLRLVASVALAAALAVPLGFAMGTSRSLDALVDPLVEVMRPISGIAWIPLALFIFGIGNGLPVFIMTYTAFFPVLIGTIAGVRGVDRTLVNAARVMGLPPRRIATTVILPGTLPALLVALRLGVAQGWTAVIAAELVGAPSGLGYEISWYRELLITPRVIAFIAMVGVCGYLSDLLLRRLIAGLTPWAAEAAAR